jgi:hypothetical protein
MPSPATISSILKQTRRGESSQCGDHLQTKCIVHSHPLLLLGVCFLADALPLDSFINRCLISTTSSCPHQLLPQGWEPTCSYETSQHIQVKATEWAGNHGNRSMITMTQQRWHANHGIEVGAAAAALPSQIPRNVSTSASPVSSAKSSIHPPNQSPSIPTVSSSTAPSSPPASPQSSAEINWDELLRNLLQPMPLGRVTNNALTNHTIQVGQNITSTGNFKREPLNKASASLHFLPVNPSMLLKLLCLPPSMNINHATF